MKNDNIKVSVIVPIYNVEKFVGKCIETIIKQQHDNLEIILVDDGSIDDSGRICDKYAQQDKRIKVIHKKNGGVSAARNSGLDIATGEYICFVDGDDYVTDDYVSYMLKVIKKYDTDIMITRDSFSNYNKKQSKNEKIEIWSGEEATIGILCYKTLIGVYSKMFKKNFLEQDIRFFEDLVIGEGFNFNILAFQKADKVVVSSKKIYYYRKDNINSVTTKFNAWKWENGIMALEKIKDNLKYKTNKVLSAWRYAYWRTNSDAFDQLVLAKAEKKYPEMYKRLKQITKKQAKSAFRVKTSIKNKTRALIMMIFPRFIPFLMNLRRKIHHIEARENLCEKN